MPHFVSKNSERKNQGFVHTFVSNIQLVVQFGELKRMLLHPILHHVIWLLLSNNEMNPFFSV
jgi:hypothetical protein